MATIPLTITYQYCSVIGIDDLIVNGSDDALVLTVTTSLNIDEDLTNCLDHF